MQFESLAALWEMSGHGPYVWGAYAIALIVLIGIVGAPLARQRKFFAQQQQIERRRAQPPSRLPE
ncbi:MAG: heme exporter protein CcmD [Spongiibacteraceae bacterium]